MQEGKVSTEPVKETKNKRAKPKPAPATSDLQLSGQELGSLEEGGGELMMQNHAALLADPRVSHPTNRGRRAGMVTQLQRRYGNTYVQRVVEYLQASVDGELNEESFEEMIADPQQHEGSQDLPGGITEQKLEGSPGSDEGQMPLRTDGIIHSAGTPGLQRQVDEEEEPIQAELRAESVQPQTEEEEPIQAKAGGVQVQRQDIPEEEEELVQGKVAGQKLQRQMPEEEEPIQAKPRSESVQPQIEEEEPIQAELRSDSVQLQIEEEEEPVQTQSSNQLLQKQEKPLQVKAVEVQLQKQRDVQERELKQTRFGNKVLQDQEKSLGRANVIENVKSPLILQRKPTELVQRQGGGPPIPLGGKVFQERTICQPNVSVGALPIKFKAVKVGGELSVSMARRGAGSTQVGFESSGEEHAVTVEHGVIWDQATTPFGDVTIQSKGEAKVTTKGNVEVGLEVLGAKFKNGSAFTLKVNVFSTDREKSEINILNAVVSRAFSPITGTTTASNGATLNWEAKGTVSLVFEPDYAKIGRWVAEKFGKQAAAELGMAGAFVAGGILTIAAALVNIAQRDEAREWTDEAIRLMNEYCRAFQGTLAKTDWSVSTEIGFEGEVAANKFLKQAESPPEAIHEEAKKRSFRGEAFSRGWPQVKSLILKKYLEEHSVEEFFYGKKGQGYRLLEQVLDTVDEKDLDIKPGEKSYY